MTTAPPAPPFLDHLARESDRFLTVMADADPAARVPTCPDWDAGDLLWHLAGVQWFWASIVAERRTSADGLELPPRPSSHEDLLEFGREQADRLHSVLTDTDPATEVWMWAQDKTVGYIVRRQAHEALIHRLDAELTVGQVTPLDPSLAADGVAETIAIMYGGCPPWGTFTPSGDRVALDLTDLERTLLVDLGQFVGTDPDTGTTYDEPDIGLTRTGAAAARIAGTAEDLDAWLWHRRDESALVPAGDPAVLDRLRAILAQPIN